MNEVLHGQKKQHKTPTEVTNAATEDNFYHQAFVNCLHANIIFTDIAGKILLANGPALKLLGYSKKEILTKALESIFDIGEPNFKNNQKQITSGIHPPVVVTAIKKNGGPLACEITSSIFKGKDGFEKVIITILDISQRILQQKAIDIKKEQIVANNIAIAKSKQKKIDTRKEAIVADNITIAKSKQKDIDLKKEKLVADNMLAHEKSNDAKLENEIAIRWQLITEYEKNFKLVFNSSSDVLYDHDITSDEVIISEAYEKEFGYKITNNMTPLKDWLSHIHPDDKEALYKDYLRMLSSEDTDWKYTYRILRADNSTADVFSSAIVLRNTSGKAYRMIGYMKDLSKQTIADANLKQTEGYLKEYILGLEEMMFMTSHKIRHPVANILGVVAQLDDSLNLPEKQKELIDYIKHSALSLDSFTRELTSLMSALEKIAPFKRSQYKGHGF